MKLKPLFDRVIIVPKKAETKTSGGIMLPSTSQEKSHLATVVSVGQGLEENGKLVEMKLGAGQTVLYSKYAGSEFKLDGEDYIIIKQTDILAIVEQ